MESSVSITCSMSLIASRQPDHTRHTSSLVCEAESSDSLGKADLVLTVSSYPFTLQKGHVSSNPNFPVLPQFPQLPLSHLCPALFSKDTCMYWWKSRFLYPSQPEYSNNGTETPNTNKWTWTVVTPVGPMCYIGMATTLALFERRWLFRMLRL